MINSNNTLTLDDAYDATQHYINRYYVLTNSDDAAILAGDMMLLTNNTPFDPAMQEDWLEALNFIKPHQIDNTKLTIDEAYSAMVKFLEIYCSMGADDDFLEFTATAGKKDFETWQNWLDSVKEITSHTPRKRPYFQLLPK